MIATLYILSIKYIVILVAIIGLIYVVKKPKYAFYIMVFTFPFKNFYIYVGTDLQVWKFLSMAFLIIQLPKWLLKQHNPEKINKYGVLLATFFVYVVLITIVNGYFIDEQHVREMLGGYFKNEGRIYFQIIFFVLTLNLIIIPLNVLKTVSDIVTTLHVLLYALIILAVLGVLQYIIVHFTGVDPFPIHGINEVHSGFVLGIHDSVFRINSWAGEPKHMAIAMVVGITIILLGRMYKVKILKHNLWILALFVFNLVFTYSTTGYVLMTMVLMLLLFIRGITHWRSIVLMISIVIIASISAINMSNKDTSAFDKQVSRAGIEIQDETIKSYFLDQPGHAIIGTGLGNIHHYAVQYFPISFPLFRDTPYKANSGLLFMLSDFGLIGILLLYFTFALLIGKNLSLLRSVPIEEKKAMEIIIYLALIFSVLFLARYNELFFILFGLMFSLNHLMKKSRVLNRKQIKDVT